MDCAENGYALGHVPRSSGQRGGGVSVLTNNSVKMTSCLQPVNVAQSFESMEIIITIVSIKADKMILWMY